MKLLVSFLILISFTLMFSCKENIETGFSYTHTEKGLSFTQCMAIQWNDTLNNNIVTLDSTVEMQFIGCSGFKIVEGKAFVGASLTLADSTGSILFQDEDIFLDYDSIGFDPTLVKERIGIFLETSHPMKKGGTYKWTNIIWDKKGNGTIETQALITVK